MIEIIFTTIFVIIVLILAFHAKNYLYINEHTQSIQEELNTFDANMKAINNLDISDYKIGSSHMYQK